VCSVEQVNPRQVERLIKKKWCTRTPGALAGTTTTPTPGQSTPVSTVTSPDASSITSNPASSGRAIKATLAADE